MLGLGLLPVASGSGATTHACGSMHIAGRALDHVRATRVSCAHAEQMLAHYHATGRGLRCEVTGDAGPIAVRCTAHVPAATGGRRRVEAVITYRLPECGDPGDCGT